MASGIVRQCATIAPMSEPEHEYETTIEDLRITVDKVGGGTLGKSYVGRWEVTVNGGPVVEMWTGTPKTHKQAAEMVRDFMQADA